MNGTMLKAGWVLAAVVLVGLLAMMLVSWLLSLLAKLLMFGFFVAVAALVAITAWRLLLGGPGRGGRYRS